MEMKNVYFDSAATTQLRPGVIGCMSKALETYGNPSSTHSYGRSAKAMLENSRKVIAKQLNVSASEIIFTSGGTEADNLILNSCARDLNITRIISSKIEHHAVLHTIEEVSEKYDIEISYVQLDDCGHVNYHHLEKLLEDTSHTTLVSLMHVNNEIGNILDIQHTAELCKKYGAYFHSDMVQSIGHFDIDFSTLPVDFAAVAAHKFHGPKGTGFAFVRKNSGLKPLIYGGAQERGLRAGTEAVYAIVGMAEALRISYENLEKEKAYITSLKNYFKKELLQKIGSVSFNGACDNNEKSTYTLLICVCLFLQKKE